MADEVRYDQRGRIALITLNRPRYANAQNSAMTYALDAAFARAANDDQVAVLVLAGAGDHFCAGHDIGTPERDADKSFDRQAVLWWDHVGRSGADARYAREMEVYLGMCRRWREIPKPAIAMVHGACIAGGLMLAWVCDLIVAAQDAFFADPVVRMGIPGVEYFAHPWMLGPRFAKEVLFTGGRFTAERAWQAGMVNRVVPRGELETATLFAADAGAAGLVLLAQDDTVYRARLGATHRSVDPARSLSEAHGGEVLARHATAAMAAALDLGALACSAQLLGAGRALLEASVRHVSVRVQFGRPVGAFQAVKHKLADVAIGLEFARPLLDAAAVALADGSETAGPDVSAAKVACADAAYRGGCAARSAWPGSRFPNATAAPAPDPPRPASSWKSSAGI